MKFKEKQLILFSYDSECKDMLPLYTSMFASSHTVFTECEQRLWQCIIIAIVYKAVSPSSVSNTRCCCVRCHASFASGNTSMLSEIAHWAVLCQRNGVMTWYFLWQYCRGFFVFSCFLDFSQLCTRMHNVSWRLCHYIEYIAFNLRKFNPLSRSLDITASAIVL